MAASCLNQQLNPDGFEKSLVCTVIDRCKIILTVIHWLSREEKCSILSIVVLVYRESLWFKE